MYMMQPMVVVVAVMVVAGRAVVEAAMMLLLMTSHFSDCANFRAELSVWFRVSQKCSRVSQKCKGYQIAARRGRSIKNPYLKDFQRTNLVK